MRWCDYALCLLTWLTTILLCAGWSWIAWQVDVGYSHCWFAFSVGRCAPVHKCWAVCNAAIAVIVVTAHSLQLIGIFPLNAEILASAWARVRRIGWEVESATIDGLGTFCKVAPPTSYPIAHIGNVGWLNRECAFWFAEYMYIKTDDYYMVEKKYNIKSNTLCLTVLQWTHSHTWCWMNAFKSIT